MIVNDPITDTGAKYPGGSKNRLQTMERFGMRNRFSFMVCRVAAVLSACAVPGMVRAGDADVKATLPIEGGGRIEHYMDGMMACFDKNDRPSMAPTCADAIVKATLSTDGGGRIEFYMDGMVACFDKNDRASMGPACKEKVGGDKALLLTAGRLEREGKESLAKSYYETLIRLHPDSETAIRANDRLMQLSDSDKSAARQQRQVEEIRKIAGEKQRAEDARQEQAREDDARRERAAREDAEKQRGEARVQRFRDCRAMDLTCVAGCSGLSDKGKTWLDRSPRSECKSRCQDAYNAC